MSFIISPTGGSPISFAAMSSKWYTTVGRYYQTTPKVHPWKNKVTAQPAPGAIGRFIKRFGKDTRTVDRIIVHYVAATADAVVATYDDDVEAVINIPGGNVLVIPNRPAAILAAECIQFEMYASPRNLLIEQVGDLYRARCSLVFEQMREL